MPSFIRKIRILPGIMMLGFLMLALPVACAIITAIWLAGAAALENIKFARCTEQALSLIALAQDDAAKDPTFGQSQNEDIIDDLIRRGQIQNSPGNVWGGTIRATVQPLPFMRFETDLPSYACRRLALYFGKNASDLKLQKMEAREGSGAFYTFYDMAVNPNTSEFPGMIQACGNTSFSTLALTTRLR
jgi:hypothetical protein